MTRIALLSFLTAALAAAQRFDAGPQLDSAIEDALRKDQMPGAVLLIGQNGQIVHEKAYGSRALVPAREPMTLDTIFDAASLTKVVATTSAVMKLVEQGKIRLNDKVTVHLPGFQGGKSNITIRNLMTHFSGLRPDLDLRPEWSGYETGIRKALIDKPRTEPGERFVYSDINYILLGEIVHKISGKMLNEYCRDEIFAPLAMKESMFNPPASLRPRIAPTEQIASGVLRGVVHDETTRFMGGVAGHAGLFTTARDLARFADMLLGRGPKVLSPLTIRKATYPQSPADQAILRGLGWDMDSPFSGNRGELYPIGSFGHTGFTGTSLWVDPATDSYVILLANSVHPMRRPAITALRGRIATIAAAGLGVDAPGAVMAGYNETIAGAGIARQAARNGQTLAGIDVLVQDGFARLKGKRVLLMTNHTGLTRDGKRNIDVLLAGGVKIAGLLSPEHGMAGKLDDEHVGDTKDEKTGLKVWSLYSGANRHLRDEMLTRVDTVVFDIQDVGARFYTYISSLKNILEDAAKRKLAVVVLDRPNPITGVKVEGPILEKQFASFVGVFPMPLRHGMTIGELGRMINGEEKIGARLEVVAMKGWQRGDWLDSTGLIWVDPSPNMRSLAAATLYPGVAMLEYSKNLSVGRGTDAPFEQIGADWIDGPKLAGYLNGRHIPGVRVYPVRFRPTASYFKDKNIDGVRFVLTDRQAFDAGRLGLEIGVGLQKLWPDKIDFAANGRLIGSAETMQAMKAGEDPRTIQGRFEDELAEFVARRKPYLLY